MKSYHKYIKNIIKEDPSVKNGMEFVINVKKKLKIICLT